MAANNAINNTIGTSGTTTTLAQVRSGSGNWVSYNDQTDTFGMYNNAGTPESVVSANIGSYCLDTTNGSMFVKKTDSASTGWVQLSELTQSSFVLLSSQTVSGVASVVFTSLITSTYATYMLVSQNVSASETVSYLLRISTDNGSSYLTTGYTSGLIVNQWNSASWSNGTATTYAQFLNNMVSTDTGNSTTFLYNLTNGSNFYSNGTGSQLNAGNLQNLITTSTNATANVNAIQISTNTGSFSGTFALYGLTGS